MSHCTVLPRNVQLAAQSFVALHQRDSRSPTRCSNCRHHAGSAAADYKDSLRHAFHLKENGAANPACSAMFVTRGVPVFRTPHTLPIFFQSIQRCLQLYCLFPADRLQSARSPNSTAPLESPQMRPYHFLASRDTSAILVSGDTLLSVMAMTFAPRSLANCIAFTVRLE